MREGTRSIRSGGTPYAVLNLPQSLDGEHPISYDRIRDSYKRLSRLLHPDKHPPGKERDDAQDLFIELHYACKSERTKTPLTRYCIITSLIYFTVSYNR